MLEESRFKFSGDAARFEGEDAGEGAGEGAIEYCFRTRRSAKVLTITDFLIGTTSLPQHIARSPVGLGDNLLD